MRTSFSILKWLFVCWFWYRGHKDTIHQQEALALFDVCERCGRERFL